MSKTYPVNASPPVVGRDPVAAIPEPSSEPAFGTRPEEGYSSLVVRIHALLPGLATAEQRVARVVLDDPPTVAQRSITDIATAADTSETTVTRFCKTIGVPGYPALRIALAAETGRRSTAPAHDPSGEIQPDDDVPTLISKIGYADARAIEDTTGQLDVNAVERAIDAIAGANRVDIYGVGGSSLVADDLQQKLHRIGRIGFAWSDPHLMLSSAAVLGRDDVALAVSHTGTTADTVQALRLASARGAMTVAITNFPRAQISEAADYVLTTAARETGLRSGETTSRIAQLTVIDCLFVGVARRDATKAARTLNTAHEAVGAHRLTARQDGRRKYHNGSP